MHLLYLDGSGSATKADEDYFVLGGLSVFERQVYWLSKELDAVAERIDPHSPAEVEFHGVEMLGGRKRWRRILRHDRTQLICDALNTIYAVHGEVHLFGAAVHKAAISPRDPVEYAFEQLCNRFDRFLGRKHLKGQPERGLIILDDSAYESRLQILATNFRTIGHTWGATYNIAEVPLFVDSRATRLVELADLIAYGMYQYYEKSNSTFFDLFKDKFNKEGDVLHGLVHYTPIGQSSCDCPACEQYKRMRDGRQRG